MMKTYRAYFERINFGYDPVLKQTADVVFSTDIQRKYLTRVIQYNG